MKIIILIYLLVTLIFLILIKLLCVKLSKNNYSKEIFSIYFDSEELINEATKSMRTPSFKEIIKCFIPIYHFYTMVLAILSLIYVNKVPNVIRDIAEELRKEEIAKKMEKYYGKK